MYLYVIKVLAPLFTGAEENLSQMSLSLEDSKQSARNGNVAVASGPDFNEDKFYSLGYKERVVARKADPSLVAGLQENDTEDLDWVLTNYDKNNSEAQSLEEELQRLQALRSYLILDQEREHQFERLTAMASRILDVPIALVSLVDLGRQWFMSNRGLGDVRETPRSQAFCSHAILSKDDILIIKNAKEDPRFVNNPLVTGPPHIRFYGGAPLETPEGYKLGTFCIIDTKPWPNGLDLKSKQNLKEMAALAVEVLVARRRKRERELEKSSQLVACTAHDLLTPLSGIELSLHLLKEDEDFQRKLTQQHRRGMKNVEACSDIIQEICTSVRATYAEANSSFERSLMTANLERVNVNKLVDRLYILIEPMKKDVPLKIVVDENVPQELVTDSSKLCRGAINFLAIAFKRTRKGMITLRLFVRKDADDGGKSLLFISCEDTAPAIQVDMYKYLFNPPTKETGLFQGDIEVDDDANQIFQPELCLFSVACEMNVVGGEYGFRPRNASDTGCEEYDKEVGRVSGSVFWLCIPCIELGTGADQEFMIVKKSPGAPPHSSLSREEAATFQRSLARNAVVHQRKKRALIIEDSNVVRKMLTKILTSLNFEVSQAENGMDGLEKLKSTLYDLTLCDFLMPIMDGLDCVQQYRDWEKYHRPWIRQRIVGISAHATGGDIERGMKVGMDDYKNKPVTVKVLSELIQCEDQIEMSNRLDEIERREASVGGFVGNERASGLGYPKAILNSGMPCTCLLIASKAEDEHINSMQGIIKSSGWQSTTARTDAEALTWLKMRMWDLVLVDEGLAPSVSAFREWESAKRKTSQRNIVLMTGTVDIHMARHTKPPTGINLLTAKPMAVNSLQKLLDRTLFDLNEEAVKRKAS